ncbi:hypothetical protein DSM104299_04614 [Baekduia alba]|uniref:hypothetical protein n=1 Tax=Baekduia alba TaxID=2997333 RepID=UPI00234287E1|nr:hypothetical protein [Baekduia alba]WCB95863.1 hypothetical protein DSM104299_04614 [Baekduia alba]
MDSFAHRAAGSAPDAGADLSAAARAELRWGIERVLTTHGEGERRDLARTLQRALRHLPVVMLHDRRLPGGLLAEHLAVGPGGVTVVAGWSAAELVEPLTVERLHGVFGARAELLRDGQRADRTALVAPLRERAVAIRAVIDEMAPVEAALCLDGSEAIARLRPLLVEGVVVGGPKAIAELAARDGDLHDYELAALVDLLDAALPPALRAD